jgi:hypothetical protein
MSISAVVLWYGQVRGCVPQFPVVIATNYQSPLRWIGARTGRFMRENLRREILKLLRTLLDNQRGPSSDALRPKLRWNSRSWGQSAPRHPVILEQMIYRNF